MKKLLFLLLLVPALVQAQDFRHRYFHYDQHCYKAGGSCSIGTVGSATDALGSIALSDGTDKWSLVPGVNALSLLAGTADGADDQTVTIGGGGVATHAQGAYLQLQGSDVGGANAGGAIILRPASGANGYVQFQSSTGIGVNSVARWSVAATSGDLTQDATNGGNIVMAKAGTGVLVGAASKSADLTGNASYFSAVQPVALAALYGTADAYGTSVRFYKSRKTDGTADTIVQNADDLGGLQFRGADGADFVAGAYINAYVDGTPGSADMPTRLVFSVTPDGSATPAEAMRISQDKSVSFQSSLVYAALGSGPNVPSANTQPCTAAGSTQADAQACTVDYFIYGTGADGTTGIKLLPIATLGVGKIFKIFNSNASSALKVYTDAAGELINNVAGTTAYSIPAWGMVECIIWDAANFYCG